MEEKIISEITKKVSITCFNEMVIKYENISSLNKKLTHHKDAAEFIRTLFPEDALGHYECFILVFLNRGGMVITHRILSKGSIASTTVDLSMATKYAINCNASSVICAHNHPSGNKKPSDGDIVITKRLAIALGMFDIRLIDSIIITENDDYYSFAAEEILIDGIEMARKITQTI